MKAHLFPLIAATAFATAPCHADDADFKREQDLSRLEGKEAPALQVEGWLNTKGDAAINLADLKGKVVVIDFWGVW